jgi:hypothetical protein
LARPKSVILGGARGRQEHVRRLQVAVDDAALVGVVDRLGQHRNDLGRGLCRLRSPRRRLGQAAAVHELQREERQAVVRADLVHLHDVGVLEAGHCLRLGPETGQLLLPRVRAGQNHLRGHGAVQGRLPGLVDDAHAAAPQLPQ